MVDAGDEHAKELRTAFIFQLSKNIGSMATVLRVKLIRLSSQAVLLMTTELLVNLRNVVNGLLRLPYTRARMNFLLSHRADFV